MLQAFRSAYERAGGTGAPRAVCLSYFSLGEEHTDESLRNLRTYYGNLGEVAEAIARTAPRTVEDIRATARAFEDLGADELIFSPSVPDVDQVDRLADAVL
jgi:hypothetical protein